ncbi:MAG TPA: ABC transporter ATP-binding protein, partial [Thermohalobaculum sp.]|nr:ABC transporter ATP-binding protein [Thermohalobaculum sp.]
MAADALLVVEDLSVVFGAGALEVPVMEGLSFSVAPGETLALVGESGSGKTLTGKAIMRLLPGGARVTQGRVLLRAEDGGCDDLLTLDRRAMRRLRGRRLAMIFQEPMSALSPLHTIGSQVCEALEVHGTSGRPARDRVMAIFEEVGFPDPVRAWRAYPFELSGGLRQRAMIAMAMVGNPALLIADEPTTALDVTTQAMVLDLLGRLQREHGMGLLMITHDLGVVANMADGVVVLKHGRLVERGPAAAVLTDPRHPYTRRLIEAAPKIPHEMQDRPAPAVRDPILEVRNLSKTYPGRRHSFRPDEPPVRALSGLDFRLARGRTLAVVGESGSGKTTAAKLVLRMERADPGGQIRFRPSCGGEEDVTALSGERLKGFRRQAQMVFQDPYAALSPRMSVQDIVTEPLKVHGIGSRTERRERAAYLMGRVGLSPDHLGRFPHAFSGGQRQRIAIARALALEPELLVCDEPTSALDVSVQAEVLDLMAELEAEMGLSYLFISHDLAVVARLADRVLVMRAGRVVEEGPTAALFGAPRHPYTRALLAASPEPDLEHRLDLGTVAAGAGAPSSWPEPFRYEGDAAPP